MEDTVFLDFCLLNDTKYITLFSPNKCNEAGDDFRRGLQTGGFRPCNWTKAKKCNCGFNTVIPP